MDKIFEWAKLDMNYIMELSKTHNIYVVAQDKRDKSYQQIRFLYMILNEFAKNFNGDNSRESIEDIKNSFYEDFCRKNNIAFFRTKTASVTEMRLFIDWLLKELAKEYNLTIALELIDESFKDSWIYAMTMARKCCVCGRSQAQIHHIDKVGMGQDRTRIDHTKKRVIALCDTCHKIEHQTGKLVKQNELYGIKLSKHDLDILRLKGVYEDIHDQITKEG